MSHRNLTEFAVIERFATGTNEIWTKGRNVIDVLKAFTHDQRQALQIWTEDMAVQVKEFLAEKYPGHDMTRIAENFLHRFTEADLQNCPHIKRRIVSGCDVNNYSES